MMTPYEAKVWLERAMQLGGVSLERSFADSNFEKQSAFVIDQSRFIVAQCSRRAGKTNGLALRFFKTLADHPGAFCLYVALTRESARNILWPMLQEIDARFQIGCVFTESNLTMTHPNGARLQLFGADMKNFIRRLKGIKTPGAAIDEAQDFGDHLQSLVDDVISPALTDYADSWLAITGTPGPIPRGYFYEITAQKRHGFSFHSWVIDDNPYLPDAAAFLEDLKKRRGWDDNHPTLPREWGNQWVLDTNSLLIRYFPEVNDFPALPRAQYQYILGVDFGIRDADALAVIAWCDSSPNIYLVEEIVTNGQGITELVEQIRDVMRRYDVCKIVADEGALGKKVAEEMRRRHAIPIYPADKARKTENVAILNDFLRQGKFKAKKDSSFAKDSYLLQIDWEHTTPDKLKVKSSFHSDIIDAVLYAVKECPAFAYEPPRIKPARGTPQWDRELGEEMWEQERQRLLQEESEKNYELWWDTLLM